MANEEHYNSVQAAFGQLGAAGFAANGRNIRKGLLFRQIFQLGDGALIINVHRANPPTRADYLRELGTLR
jgi:hypothetical protein